MLILVCYDVRTEEKAGRRRLARMAKQCKNHGQRVQKSVFECQLSDSELVGVRRKLLDIIDPEEDSLRMYRIAEPVEKHREEYGTFKAMDFRDPVVV
ncbi:MAG: CRISPR-associated endonuclease Cas2 [Armatimonadota bacterium]